MAEEDIGKGQQRNYKLLSENRELKSEKDALEKQNVELSIAVKKLRTQRCCL